jgi:hypothetical protein
MTELRKIERKTYTRQVYEDEAPDIKDKGSQPRMMRVLTSPRMVEVAPHQYVNEAAARWKKLIEPSDTLLPPNDHDDKAK